jgi:phospholipase C
MVVEENHRFDDIIGSPDAPTINRLAREGTLLTSYYAITNPSLPNYLAMLAGTTAGVRDDCTRCSVSVPNLVDQLETAHISWAAYFPGLPGTCSTVAKAGAYAKKHDPFLYFPSIRDDPARCAHVVPFDGFAADAAAGRLPQFVFVSPDMRHDMHDGSVRAADGWLDSLYDQLRRSPAWREDTRLVVVFDEGRRGDNHVAAVVAGPQVPAGSDDGHYTHYSLLRSIEAAFGLPYLDQAARAAPIPVLARR